MTREQMIAWLTLEGWEVAKCGPTGVAGVRKTGSKAIGVAMNYKTYWSECDWFASNIPNGEQWATEKELGALCHAVEFGPDH